jgi:hypothetical protein
MSFMSTANDPLANAKEILNDLETDLTNIREFWRQVEIDNPGFDVVSEENWNQKHARCWLHGATDVKEIN